MKFKRIFLLILLVSIFVLSSFRAQADSKEIVLSEHTFSMENRYAVKAVSDVFKDNILLSFAYFRGKVSSAVINWKEVEKPFTYDMELRPGEVFAFHDAVLSQFRGKQIKTTHAHFNFSEGFKSDGYLIGDGVCHLASLMYWTAKDAGLDTLAPTNHDFANIPEVPKKYGVAIFSNPGNEVASTQQNLYITNTLKDPITFRFEYDGKELKVTVVKK